MNDVKLGSPRTLLAAALVLCATLALANPAAAYVVAVTTSVPASTMADDADLAEAVAAAVDDVLTHVIAFRPAFVRVQAANLAGGRLYITLLIGDRDGDAAMNKLAADPEPERVLQ